MNEIKKIVLGNTTEKIISLIFDNHMLQESMERNKNQISRDLRIRDLKSQLMGFIRRNANAIFELNFTEYMSDKVTKIIFTNFDGYDLEDAINEDEFSHYIIDIDTLCSSIIITHKVKIGKNITITLQSRK